jgi:hypothetical protein
MMQFHPDKRITVEDALAHNYFDSVRAQYDDKEPELPESFEFKFESETLTLPDYRDLILEEVRAFKKERIEAAAARRAARRAKADSKGGASGAGSHK